MTSSTAPLVLRRDRRRFRRQLLVRCVLAACAAGLAGAGDGVAFPLRMVLVGVLLALALRPSRNLLRTTTVDAEGLRRGFRRWTWSALTSVELGPPASEGRGPPLGSVTLRFGEATVSFGRDWPLEALLVEVLARAPLEAQVARALDQKEREHGLGFGALWLGPRFLDLRRQDGTAATRVPLQGVRDVALELTRHQAVIRMDAGERRLEVPLAELRDPHVLATLLARQGSRGSTSRVPLAVRYPHPFDATAPDGVVREKTTVGRFFSGIPIPVYGILLGGLAFCGMGLQMRADAEASQTWRAVPAEITATSTWKEPYRSGSRRTMIEHGSIQFQFVLDGTVRMGSNYDHDGTSATQARRVKVGQKVTAYVPPDQPWKAVLDRDVTGNSHLVLFLGVAFVGFALWVAVFQFKRGWGA